ncbi:MAG: MFS transporter [Candidatus Bathycorpusculaceae bacterium]
MWRLGFFFHKMAFGLLSVFLPLYIVAIGGSLLDIGIMASAALFFAIPAAFFWGYICDKTRRYKRYILISFLSAAVFLYVFTITSSVGMLTLLYTIMSMLHVAYEAPKNVLIAEFYTREDWERSYALYEALVEGGWLIGLLLGFFSSTFGFDARSTLLLCSGLNLLAFLVSLILVTDPMLIFERRLVSMERTIGFAYKGVVIASKLLDGLLLDQKIERDNMFAFCSGLVLFSLASSTLFTPLPIFFSNDLALSASAIFVIYILNSCGGVLGYFLAIRHSVQLEEKVLIRRITLFRGALVFLLIVFAQIFAYAAILAAAVLILMGFAYALYFVYTLSLSMELIPAGKAGLFNVLISVGGACGSFLGPFIAQILGFNYLFLIAGGIFILAYITFIFS